jgi:hypothetical protein
MAFPPRTMREPALRSILLVKAVEETDREGMLIAPADRAAATREASRADGGGERTSTSSAGPVPPQAGRLLARRAEALQRRLAARFPFVESVLALAGGPRWITGIALVVSLLLGLLLSALDGTKRINILAFPLLGLVLWNMIVYLALCVRSLRAWARGRARAPSPLARTLAHSAFGRLQRFAARSAAFNAPLAEALSRFAREWYDAAKPLLFARATRLFHLCAAVVALGLIAGLYLRGIALDYRAGWESTWLDAAQAHRILSVAYGPASWLTGIPIPDAARLSATRWEGERGGESAAQWMHLLAATALLLVVLPRLALAFVDTLVVWRRAHAIPMPASLVPYFRVAFGAVEGAVSRGIIAVVPYAYEPASAAIAALKHLLPAALGSTLAVDVRAPVRYGDEEAFLRALADRDASIADAVTLLFSMASTPEEENHGSMIVGVRDGLARSGRPAQLLILVDERPYAARMAAQAGYAARLDERRRVWEGFVAARGLRVCFVDLDERSGVVEPASSEAQRVRGALWQPTFS